jgi:tetratricopeptide (TPR) repeat protein
MSITKEQILFYVENPLELDDHTLDDLKGILEEFPYFQSAHLLYVSNLLQEKNYKFEGQLKLAAAHVNDRTVLYHLLNNYEILKERKPDVALKLEAQSVNEEIKETEPSFNDDELIELIEDPKTEESVNNNRSSVEKSDVLPVEDSPGTDIIEPVAYQLEDMETIVNQSVFPLINEINRRSRRKLSLERKSVIKEKKKIKPETKTIVPAETKKRVVTEEQNVNKKNKVDLIDRFITNKPVISKLDPTFESSSDISEISENYDDEFITETLARIYVKQGYYQKAINAFKKLSLKYPEKSTYFAGQIEEISKLLNK